MTIYTLTELSRILKMSESYLYKAAQKGHIPVIRVGRSLRFDDSVSTHFFKNARNRKNLSQAVQTITPYDFPNTSVYPECPFAVMGIDKIGILTNSSILQCLTSPDELKDKLVIITHGNFSRLIFQGEHINPAYPLYSIACLLMEAIYYGVFRFQFAEYLRWHCYVFLNLYHDPVYFVTALFINGPFKWNELEIFFDIYGENLPFSINNPALFLRSFGTYYTKDYKNIKRKVYRNDGTSYEESKGKHRSLLAIYDRGKKLDSVYPDIDHGPITRLEIRICDIKAESLLNPYDMRLTLSDFVSQNSERILKKFKRGILSENGILFDKDFIDDQLPFLPYLIPCTLQCDCLSVRKDMFPSKNVK